MTGVRLRSLAPLGWAMRRGEGEVAAAWASGLRISQHHVSFTGYFHHLYEGILLYTSKLIGICSVDRRLGRHISVSAIACWMSSSCTLTTCCCSPARNKPPDFDQVCSNFLFSPTESQNLGSCLPAAQAWKRSGSNPESIDHIHASLGQAHFGDAKLSPLEAAANLIWERLLRLYSERAHRSLCD